MNKPKILSMLGLAQKAGKISDGAFLAEKSLKSGNASLCIISEDASERTARKISGICRSHEVPVKLFGSMEEIGRAVGTKERSVISVNDDGFAHAIVKLIEE